MQKVLIVDDVQENIVVLAELLADKHEILIANNGEIAIEIAKKERPDLILMDVLMPVMDGYEACSFLKADPGTHDIPLIFVTSQTDLEDEMKSFALGAVDYITKPISPPVVLARVQTHLQLKRVSDYLKDKNEFLEAEVQRRLQEIAAVQEVTILAMASLAETRDNETGNHIRRTQFYIKTLAEKLRHHHKFSYFLDDEKTINLLFKSAPLHDIGKVGIPDNILLKPGPLTEIEFEIMKTHCRLGVNAILSAERRLGVQLPFLKFAKEIAYTHHEKWDGTGYPQGLPGEDIPISGRLMALADVYDALTSHRVYKEIIPHEEALEIMMSGKNTHFDPTMIDAFIEIADEFKIIAAKYRDFDTEKPESAEADKLFVNMPAKDLPVK